MSRRALQILALGCAAWLAGGPLGGGSAVASIASAGGPAGSGGVSSQAPHAPPGALTCLERYLRNMQRCTDLWCEPVDLLLFTVLDCEDEQLDQCEQQVWAGFLACLEARG